VGKAEGGEEDGVVDRARQDTIVLPQLVFFYSHGRGIFSVHHYNQGIRLRIRKEKICAQRRAGMTISTLWTEFGLLSYKISLDILYAEGLGTIGLGRRQGFVMI